MIDVTRHVTGGDLRTTAERVIYCPKRPDNVSNTRKGRQHIREGSCNCKHNAV